MYDAPVAKPYVLSRCDGQAPVQGLVVEEIADPERMDGIQPVAARIPTGAPNSSGERHRIWPIVQITDWGERVPVQQVAGVLERGARRPASGVIVFAWSGLRKQPEKIDAIGRAFRAMQAAPPAPQLR